MRYLDYRFSITREGLKLDDKGEPDLTHQVQLSNTGLEVGDSFTLELDEDNCMFFKKNGPIQTELNFYEER
tara:strand:+ start:34 stop:246 length:213 start_codon:yes stop_codon:yes gene_type:complete